MNAQERILAVAALVLLAGASAGAAELRIRPDASILAVVTHKAGFASGLAHNHLIAASGYTAELDFDEAAIAGTRFRVRLRGEDLVVDDPELQAAWLPRLRELGILDEPFGEVDDKDRGKIREAMLGRKQLDAEAFPEISAEVVAVRPADAADAAGEFPWIVSLALEVRGQRVERDLAARYEHEGGELSVEAYGTFRFTDLGIKPYSAFLGAVKNRDEFHLYVRLVAGAPE